MKMISHRSHFVLEVGFSTQVLRDGNRVPYKIVT